MVHMLRPFPLEDHYDNEKFPLPVFIFRPFTVVFLALAERPWGIGWGGQHPYTEDSGTETRFRDGDRVRPHRRSHEDGQPLTAADK